MLSHRLPACQLSRPVARLPVFVPRAYECQKWDVERYGELNEENIGKVYRPQGYAVVVGRMEAGPMAKRHAHTTENTLFVLDGDLKVEFDNQTLVIQPGEYFDVPIGVEHIDCIGENGAVFGTATKEFGLGLVFKTVNFGKRLTSIFGK